MNSRFSAGWISTVSTENTKHKPIDMYYHSTNLLNWLRSYQHSGEKRTPNFVEKHVSIRYESLDFLKETNTSKSKTL